MKYYIAIDGGTTNTRVNLVLDGRVVSGEKISIGAKDCVNGSEELKGAIINKIDNLCLQNGINPDSICAIIASGMITCEYGLFPLNHIPAPAGIGELHKGLACAEGLLGGRDCYFIPGVRLQGEGVGATDMMRGEEAEIMGIFSPEYSEAVFILPGSHSKHIYLDKEGRISSFKTQMSGEMISALASGTILKGTVRLDFGEFDREALLSGFDTAEELGINDALFKVRIMKNVFKSTDLECYSFFIGVVMHDEVVSLKKSGAKHAVIGGKGQLRESLAEIIRCRSEIKVTTLSDEVTESASAIGAVKIFEYGE